MVFIRNFILCSHFLCLSILPLKAMENDSKENHPITKIVSLKKVQEDIETLLLTKKGLEPKSICVVLDFHGVIVNEEAHQEKLTLKINVIDILQYLKDKGVSYLVATAWIPFQNVIKEGIVDLELQDFFSVNPAYVAEREDFRLGREKIAFKGYRNGRVVALKYTDSYNAALFDHNKDPYFRQKAYAIELCYPDTEITYILFVDDSKPNVEQFREDANNITQTAYKNFEDLFLYHLPNSK